MKSHMRKYSVMRHHLCEGYIVLSVYAKNFMLLFHIERGLKKKHNTKHMHENYLKKYQKLKLSVI